MSAHAPPSGTSSRPNADGAAASATGSTTARTSRRRRQRRTSRDDSPLGPELAAPPDAHLGPTHPCGWAAGSLAFVGAWAAAFGVGRLTGSAAIVLLLVAAAVGGLAAATSGWWRLRGVAGLTATGPRSVDTGEHWELRVELDERAPRSAALGLALWPHDRPDEVAVTVIGATETVDVGMSTPAEQAGTIERFDGWITALGVGGLVWWRRRIVLHVEPIEVAPGAAGAPLPVRAVDEHASSADGGGGGHATDGGEIGGVRPWRPGEQGQSIHWPSTIRHRSVIAHDREHRPRRRGRLDLDQDPARIRRTLDDAVRNATSIDVVLPDGTSPATVRTPDEAAHWATRSGDLDRERRLRTTPPERRPPFGIGSPTRRAAAAARAEPSGSSVSARWWAAVAAAIALNMLVGALGDPLSIHLAVTIGVGIGAALSIRITGAVATRRARLVVTLLALGALVRIAVDASGVDGLVEALRGPMPDLLLVLLVLHGAETIDRRTVRVHLAITGVVVAYATGLRLDDRVGWWLAGWGAAAVFALTELTVASPDTRRASDRRRASPGDRKRATARAVARTTAWLVLGSVAVLGVASLVPVPDGPADLGLPSLSDDDAVVDRPGTLAGPDGRPVSDTDGAPERGTIGSPGSYRGFSETLDTSIRGDLGEELVMRVRAPEPAFWRGQTFSDFDGRTWRVSGGDGTLADGPRIDVPPTMGDLAFGDIPTEELRQTFHVETDLPNLVFAASRASSLVFDGSVWLRPDGALRADRTLTDGSIYTVVSERAQVTDEVLRAQGDLAVWFDPARGDPRLEPLLALPDSTSERTIELATELRVEGSTYDTIRAYERWLGANTEYDLDAPVPAEGADAVDDFLFVSQRGYCEQIASTLVVMLRSQGVPARLATGYVPGERDRVSGVWNVRAEHAHAWVEVWFPVTGWQAFDPTANVPLAGDADRQSVGADLIGALWDVVDRNVVTIAGISLGALALLAGIRRVTTARRRRRRGPWGRLHDRFAAVAGRAADAEQLTTRPRTTAAMAEAIEGLVGATSDSARVARDVAAMLDRVAFDPAYRPGDDDAAATAAMIAALERDVRRTVRTASTRSSP